MKTNPKSRIAAPCLVSGRHAGLALVIATLTLAVATPSSAQNQNNVPVPKPAPKGRDGTQMSDTQKGGPVTTGATAAAPNPVQVGPDGTKTKGDFYIQKPGKVRFEYDPPTTIDIVADGSSLAVRDRNLATQDIYPLAQTPLRFLLSDRIDLLKDTNVVSVASDDMFISITIEEKQALIGTSRLMLMIGTKDGQLKQWTVTDPQGYDTTVAVYNLDTSKKVDPGMFKIDFTSYATPPG